MPDAQKSLSTLMHDLNNALAGISGAVELLKHDIREAPSHTAREHLGMLELATKTARLSARSLSQKLASHKDD